MNAEPQRSSHPRPTGPGASLMTPKCINGAIWSRTSSAVSRHSDALQPATKKPMLALPDFSISSPLSSQSGDCKQALVDVVVWAVHDGIPPVFEALSPAGGA